MNQNEQIKELETRLKNLIKFVKSFAMQELNIKLHYYEKSKKVSYESIMDKLDKYYPKLKDLHSETVNEKLYKAVRDVLETHKDQNLAFIIGNLDSFNWDEDSCELFWIATYDDLDRSYRNNKNEIQIGYFFNLLDEKTNKSEKENHDQKERLDNLKLQIEKQKKKKAELIIELDKLRIEKNQFERLIEDELKSFVELKDTVATTIEKITSLSKKTGIGGGFDKKILMSVFENQRNLFEMIKFSDEELTDRFTYLNGYCDSLGITKEIRELIRAIKD